MAKFQLTPKAVNDLSDIWDYTFEVWSERQADVYHAQLISACTELANNPLLGREYEQVGKGILGYRVNNHIIFYILSGSQEILVARILHGKMDLEERIKE